MQNIFEIQYNLYCQFQLLKCNFVEFGTLISILFYKNNMKQLTRLINVNESSSDNSNMSIALKVRMLNLKENLKQNNI